MKLMKKILAIVCTFVMIISMATGVNAVDESSTTQPKGSITVTNAAANETYKAYKILSLESYDEQAQAYSYKRPGGSWDGFINSNIDKFFVSDSEGYITLKSTKDDEVRKLAINAIGFAQKNNLEATVTATASASETGGATAVFENLDLGYYVIESTSGTACNLTTALPNVTITDKHKNPSVIKKIVEGGNIINEGAQNSVNIGDSVGFETTISVTPGIKNYILHDKMDNNLEFSRVSDVKLFYPNESDTNNQNKIIAANDYYIVKSAEEDGSALKDKCTFELSFTPRFYSEYKEAIDKKLITKITVRYYAKVKNSALVNNAMKNTTWLTYGDKNTETNKSETETFTYGIPVFKYTGNNQPLAGAKFILSKQENPSDTDAIKFTQDTKDREKYTYAADLTSPNATKTLESQDSGYIKIQGLEAGTYYLKETEAPKGYNKISEPIKIEIGTNDDGTQKITVKNEFVEDGVVRVKNNTGSLLPSTGGMGTTLIYVVGSILVLASAIVLFSKKKEGNN